MPTPPLANSFMAGSEGTTISAGNSGGASGDAFTIFDNSANPTFPKYLGAIDHYSNFSLGVVDIASGVAQCGWDGFAVTTNLFARWYIYLSALPTGTNCQHMRTRDDVSGTNSITRVTTAGKAQFTIPGGTAWTGTVNVPTGRWVRFEQRWLPSTTAGEEELKWWGNSESTGPPDDAGIVTNQVLKANIGQVFFGLQGSPPTAPFTLLIAHVAISDDGWIGPSLVSPPVYNNPNLGRTSGG